MEGREEDYTSLNETSIGMWGVMDGMVRLNVGNAVVVALWLEIEIAFVVAVGVAELVHQA